VLNVIQPQSPDIAMGVDPGGAGDQGMMFGYACDETPELMPMPIMMAHKLVRQLSDVRRARTLDFLRPDGKSQVSVEYVNGKPSRIDAVVISTQHSDKISIDDLRVQVKKHIIDPILPAGMVDSGTKYHINPTGRFVVGGPHGDTGLTQFGYEPSIGDEEYVRGVMRTEVDDLYESWRALGDAAVLLRYEDLMLQPHDTLEALFAQLGLVADAETVTQVLERARARVPERQAGHRTTVNEQASMGRWRDDLTPALQEACAEAFAAPLAAFGYETGTRGAA